VYDGGGCTLSTAGYADNTWHHVVYVVDAAGGRLYVDGQQRASRAWTGPPGAPTTTEGVRVARYVGAFGGVEYASGGIDDVRIYKRALSAAEIAALYASAPQP
jgi:sialidase-1